MPPESQVLRLRSGRQRSEDRGPVAQQCCAQDDRGDEIFSERFDKRQINYIYLHCVREMLNYDNGRKTIIGAWWSHQAFILNLNYYETSCGMGTTKRHPAYMAA